PGAAAPGPRSRPPPPPPPPPPPNPPPPPRPQPPPPPSTAARAGAATAAGPFAAPSAAAAAAARAGKQPAGVAGATLDLRQSGRCLWSAQVPGGLSLDCRAPDLAAPLLSQELARKQRGGNGRDLGHHRPRWSADRRHHQSIERLSQSGQCGAGCDSSGFALSTIAQRPAG